MEATTESNFINVAMTETILESKKYFWQFYHAVWKIVVFEIRFSSSVLPPTRIKIELLGVSSYKLCCDGIHKISCRKKLY